MTPDSVIANDLIDRLGTDDSVADYLLHNFSDGTLFFRAFTEYVPRKNALTVSRFLKLIEKFGFNEHYYNACLQGPEDWDGHKIAREITVKSFSSDERIAAAVVHSVFNVEASIQPAQPLSPDNDSLNQKWSSFRFKLFILDCAIQTSDVAVKAAIAWIAQDKHQFSFETKRKLIFRINNNKFARDILPFLIQLPCEEEEGYLQKVFHFDLPGKQVINKNTPDDSPTFSAIRELLSNKPLYLSFLDSLESALASICREHHIDLKPLERTGTIIVPKRNEENYDDYLLSIEDAIPWPVFKGEAGVKTQSLLNDLLLQVERENGINTDPDAPAYFFDFVPVALGNQFVSEGNLFNECNYVGNLLHGKYSHRLQWYVIFKAIEKKHILLPPECSVKDIFKQLPLYWRELVDIYEHGFFSPHYLHAYLLSPQAAERFPNLCRFLQKTHHNSIEKIVKRDPEASAESVTLRYHLYGRIFASEFKPPRSVVEAHGEGKINRYYGGSESVFFKSRLIKTRFEDGSHGAGCSSDLCN